MCGGAQWWWTGRAEELSGGGWGRWPVALKAKGWWYRAGLSVPGLGTGHLPFETCWALSYFLLWKMVGLWMRMNLLEGHVGRRKDSRR